ncbi:uncharacterized protein LOC107637061 [Arachis ipaensis]|uniref:uncharacterized protein LOC107637061 n=1 Tax=Arachis ipaensis TaxID=130454 RepID=UPI0007AFC97E|nr:uncharacterized protein LOC107637061 [Arachis ipaensis]
MNKLQNHLDPQKISSKLNSETGSASETPSYTDWEAQDQCLVAWLMSSMEATFVNRVVEFEFAYQIWNALEDYFAARVKSRIKQLKAQLKTLKKHSSSVSEYMAKINQVADSLNALGAPLSTEDYIEAVLGGLGEEYSTFITVTNGRIDQLSESEFESQLQTQEELLERFRKVDLGYVQANLTQKGDAPNNNSYTFNNNSNNFRGDFRGGRTRGFRGGGGRSSWWQGNRPQCQVCGKIGHIALKCYHRFDQSYTNPQLQPLNAAPPPSMAFHNGKQVQHHTPQSSPQQPAAPSPQAYIALPSAVPDAGWYPDSGASHHITFDQSNLNTGSEYDGSQQVYGGNGQGMKITHVGNSILHASLSNRPFRMQNLLHVPNISKNLISVAKFALDNYVFFEFWPYLCNVKCQITRQVLLQGLLKDGLYKFEGISVNTSSNTPHTTSLPLHTPISANTLTQTPPSTIKPNKTNTHTCVASESAPYATAALVPTAVRMAPVSAATTYGNISECHTSIGNVYANITCKNSTQTMQLWHRKLGHPGDKIVSLVMKECNIPHESINKENSIPTLCQSCCISKLHQLPHPESLTSYKPLELVFSDIWGPAPVYSRLGHRYYICFIDASTRYTCTYLLESKGQAFDAFVKFKALIENKTGLKIKSIQTDNAKEYVSNAFTAYLASNEIHHRLTCPYSYQQNGTIERKHCHITETVLTLLAQASLPLSFWGDATLSATYLINRLPSPTLSCRSPLELLTGRKPDYLFLKPFGCTCYPLLKHYNPHKFDFKSHQCIFIGYSDNQKGYRCLSPLGKEFVSRDVVFNESEFPFPHLFPISTNPPPVSQTLINLGPLLFSLPTLSHQPLAPSSQPQQPLPQPLSQPSNASPLPTPSPMHSSYRISNSVNCIPVSQPSASVCFPDSSNVVVDVSSDPNAPASAVLENLQVPQLPLVGVPPSNAHPMQTQSKSGIFKPRSFATVVREGSARRDSASETPAVVPASDPVGGGGAFSLQALMAVPAAGAAKSARALASAAASDLVSRIPNSVGEALCSPHWREAM